MAKLDKENIIEMLSQNLAMFFADLDAHFMCPTCLTIIPLTDKDRISEAHIIPKAAGGTRKQLL